MPDANERKSHTCIDAGGEYTYWDIIEYNACVGCPNMWFNKSEERPECSSEICIKESGGK